MVIPLIVGAARALLTGGAVALAKKAIGAIGVSGFVAGGGLSLAKPLYETTKKATQYTVGVLNPSSSLPTGTIGGKSYKDVSLPYEKGKVYDTSGTIGGIGSSPITLSQVDSLKVSLPVDKNYSTIGKAIGTVVGAGIIGAGIGYVIEKASKKGKTYVDGVEQVSLPPVASPVSVPAEPVVSNVPITPETQIVGKPASTVSRRRYAKKPQKLPFAQSIRVNVLNANQSRVST